MPNFIKYLNKAASDLQSQIDAPYFTTADDQMLSTYDTDTIDNHDCHLSPEDSCSCQLGFDENAAYDDYQESEQN